MLKVTEIADTVCAHSHQIRLHSVHPIREHADTLPPFVTLRACGLALMHMGVRTRHRPSPKREEAVGGKVVHLPLEQEEEDDVGREDDQGRAHRHLHNIGQNEVSRLKGLIHGVSGA